MVCCSADTGAAICGSRDHTRLVSTAAGTEAPFQAEKHASASCTRSRGLARLSGNTDSLKSSWSLNNSAPPPIPLCDPSPLLFLPCEHQRSGRAATELQCCPLESREAGLPSRHLVFYFCWCQRSMRAALCCCILNAPLRFRSVFLHTYKEQLSFRRIKK